MCDEGQYQPFTHGVASEWREPLDLVCDRRTRGRRMERDDRNAERFCQTAQAVKAFASQRISPIHPTEVDVKGGGDQARTATEALQRRLGVVAHFGRPQMLSILDQGQLE